MADIKSVAENKSEVVSENASENLSMSTPAIQNTTSDLSQQMETVSSSIIFKENTFKSSVTSEKRLISTESVIISFPVEKILHGSTDMSENLAINIEFHDAKKEINTFIENYDKIECQLIEKQKLVADLKETIEDMKKDKLHLESEIHSLAVNLGESEKKFLEKCNEVNSLKSSLEICNESKMVVLKELESSKLKISQLEANLIDFDLLQTKNLQLNENLNKSLQAVKEKEEKLAQLKDETVLLKTEITTLKNQFDKSTENLKVKDEEIKASKTAFETSVIDKENEVKLISTELLNTKQELDSMKASFQAKNLQLNENLNESLQAVKEKEEKIAQLKDEISLLKTEITTLKNQFDESTKNLKAKDEEIKALKTDFETSVIDKQNECTQELESVKAICEIMEVKLFKKHRKIQKLKKEIENLETEEFKPSSNCYCKEYFTLLSGMSKDLDGRIEGNKILILESLALLKGNKASIEGHTVQELINEIKLKDKEIETLKAELETLKKDENKTDNPCNMTILPPQDQSSVYLVQKDNIIAGLWKQCEDYKLMIDELQTQKNNTDLVNHKLKEDLEKVLQKSADLEMKVKQLESENENLQKDLKNSQEENSKLTVIIENLKSEIQYLKETICFLDTEIKNKESEAQEFINLEINRRTNDIYYEHKLKLENFEQKIKQNFKERMQQVIVDNEKEMQQRVQNLQGKIEYLYQKHKEDLEMYEKRVIELTTKPITICDRIHVEVLENDSGFNRIREISHNEFRDLHQTQVSSYSHFRNGS